MFGGRGGILGPDLTQARARYRQNPLLAEMKAPWTLTEATEKTGRTIRGVRKSEDTFTLYLMDEEQKWHFLDKRNLVIARKEQVHNALDPARQTSIAAFLLKAPLTYEPTAEWKPSSDLNVTFSRLRQAAAEPQNWLTYWGDLAGRHYSGLKQITPANVASLKSTWTYQLGGNTIETTPLVSDGIMFVTGPLNNASALDARTGHPIWKYTRRLPAVASHCTVMTNRGFAMLGDRLYMATLDMHLVALDAKSGNVLWDIRVDDYEKGLSITHAPLAVSPASWMRMTLRRDAAFGAHTPYRSPAIQIARRGSRRDRRTSAEPPPG
jgi:alcohol dehydrogenase (cytochrome c)